MLSVVCNLALLAFFKYADFLIGNLNGLFGLGIPKLDLPLPIGISFYTFQAMSYLCLLYTSDRIAAFREMICADTVEGREAALAKILPYQQGDFEKLYEALEGCPVTIRFLDPPLHEFVPTEEEDIAALAKTQGKSDVYKRQGYPAA